MNQSSIDGSRNSKFDRYQFDRYLFYFEKTTIYKNLIATKLVNQIIFQLQTQDSNICKYYICNQKFDQQTNLQTFDNKQYINEIDIWTISLNKENPTRFSVNILDEQNTVKQTQIINSIGEITLYQILQYRDKLVLIYIEQFLDSTTCKLHINILKKLKQFFSIIISAMILFLFYLNLLIFSTKTQELLQERKACSKCQQGYYLNDQRKCKIDCGAYCESCDIPFTCNSCLIGYKLTEDKQCVYKNCPQGYQINEYTQYCDPICSDNCLKCSEPNLCIQCQPNYQLQSNFCFSPTDYQVNIYIVVILILVVSLFLSFIYSLYLKKKFAQIHPNLNNQEKNVLRIGNNLESDNIIIAAPQNLSILESNNQSQQN